MTSAKKDLKNRLGATPPEGRKSQFPGSRSAISGRRYYNPALGRFLGRDPIEEKGGLHLYAFVRNNAVNAWDFLGNNGYGGGMGAGLSIGDVTVNNGGGAGGFNGNFASRLTGNASSESWTADSGFGGAGDTSGIIGTSATATAIQPTTVHPDNSGSSMNIYGFNAGSLGIILSPSSSKDPITNATNTSGNATSDAGGSSASAPTGFDAMGPPGSVGVSIVNPNDPTLSDPKSFASQEVNGELLGGAAVVVVAGTVATGGLIAGAGSALPDGMGIGIIQDGQVIAADLTVATSHASLAIDAGVLGADGTLTGGAQAVTWIVENGQITTMASMNFPSETAGAEPAIEAYLRSLIK